LGLKNTIRQLEEEESQCPTLDDECITEDNQRQCTFLEATGCQNLAIPESSCPYGEITCLDDMEQDDVEGISPRFLSAQNECHWYGLECDYEIPSESNATWTVVAGDEYYPIVSMDLADNNLAGDLYDEFFEFLQLQNIAVDGNRRIAGTIPGAIANLVDLEYLDMDDNAISGMLPQALYQMTSLVVIDLNNNTLEGTISEDIQFLRNLKVVQLENNALSGPVPADALLELTKLGKYCATNTGCEYSRSD
jgi:Leucine-rich repeat (LRR) protein